MKQMDLRISQKKRKEFLNRSNNYRKYQRTYNIYHQCEIDGANKNDHKCEMGGANKKFNM